MNKVGFLFAGQWAQKVGMGKELVDENQTALSFFNMHKIHSILILMN